MNTATSTAAMKFLRSRAKNRNARQGGTVSVWGLKEEGVGLRYTTMNDDLLASIPQEVLDKVEDLKGQVSDGTIQVPGTAEEFEAFKAGR